MKKVALLCLGLAFGAVNAAEAQLTMQMSNGWAFTFSGNVNAFYIYQNSKTATPGGGFATSGKDLSVGTGLLPSFAVFDAKGKEDNIDLGVHFGFAPQVEFGGHNASYFGTDAAGAQIDMRQVYLTVGGSWGQILAGREIAFVAVCLAQVDVVVLVAATIVGVEEAQVSRKIRDGESALFS